LSKHLHIVSFDVPLPANYGGVIDVFYKLKALSELGVKIHLHCFFKDRNPQKELEKYCESVHYYKRQTVLKSLSSRLPFVVQSRNSQELTETLKKDNYPILFEGLHCTYPLLDDTLKARQTLVRAHNIEHFYYKGLANSETNLAKKLFFNQESKKLKNYETVLTKASTVLSISPLEHTYLKTYFKKVDYLPVFHQNNTVKTLSTKGNYALYVTDLRISDNQRSARFLIDVFKTIDYPLIIASSFKNKSILKKIASFKNISFSEIIKQQQADDLLAHAHLNVMLTFQATGIKLKLINTLFAGRFCLTNTPMIKDTGLASLCLSADTIAGFKNLVKSYKDKPFTEDLVDKRKKLLGAFFPQKNAQKLVGLIWN
jgi:hypothetical protein